MRMIDVVEGSSFFRPLNYLRIQNDYALKYNWVYPAILGGVLYLGVYLGTSSNSPADLLSPINKYGSLLTVLFPFYFASLAATSSLGGVPALDKKFEMAEPVTLVIKLTADEYKTLYLSPRDFISLLFAYCTTISLFLLIISFMTSGMVSAIDMLPNGASGVSMVVLAIVTLLLSQLLVATLLGVYFLSDYMVRNQLTGS